MNRYLIVVALVGALFFVACSGDDSDLPEIVLTVTDFSATVPNQSTSGLVIGQIEASSSNQADITYSLSAQTPTGAMSIDTSNGRLSIADASSFDFELNTMVDAVVTVNSGGVSRDATVRVNVDELNASQLQVIDYFQDISLGFEFGNSSQITRKWRTTMKVFVDGSPNAELMDELARIMAEIDELVTDGFEMELVDTRAESNYYLFLGSGDQYAAMFPSLATLVSSNWGLFSVWWDSESYLNRGQMYVDMERANLTEQKHLLREEFTQSLGLARDSDQYGNSIFQAAWTRTTEYADIDRELIRLLYHPDMEVGLGATQVARILRDIMSAE